MRAENHKPVTWGLAYLSTSSQARDVEELFRFVGYGPHFQVKLATSKISFNYNRTCFIGRSQ